MSSGPNSSSKVNLCQVGTPNGMNSDLEGSSVLIASDQLNREWAQAIKLTVEGQKELRLVIRDLLTPDGQLAALQHNSSSKSVATVAQRGTYIHALKTNSAYNNWIVDSGASDHMTGNSQLFVSYTPCAGNEKVRIADGTLSVIAGKGSVRVTNSITLHSVLHVLNLDCNLLSVNQLVKQNKCCAYFLPSSCVFQDRSSGATIGSAKECGGLY